MKILKKSVVALLVLFALLLSSAFCACSGEVIEDDRNGESSVYRFNVSDETCIAPHWGVEVVCEFKNATVEISHYSDKALIAYHENSTIKNVFHGESSLYEGRPIFYWMPIKGWSAETEEVIEDYITFTAKIGKNIIGYAVIYVNAVGESGSGTVLADKEFPLLDGKYQKIDQKTVDEKIQKIIEEHANSVKIKQELAGTFYTVTEAYNRGYLTRDEIESIAYYHLEQYSFLKGETEEDYSPLPKIPEELSEVRQAAIKQAHTDYHYKNGDLDRIEKFLGEKLTVSILGYYGTYNGCIAVMTTDNFTGYTGALWTETVANVNILYNDGNRIMVWVKQ